MKDKLISAAILILMVCLLGFFAVCMYYQGVQAEQRRLHQMLERCMDHSADCELRTLQLERACFMAWSYGIIGATTNDVQELIDHLIPNLKTK